MQSVSQSDPYASPALYARTIDFGMASPPEFDLGSPPSPFAQAADRPWSPPAAGSQGTAGTPAAQRSRGAPWSSPSWHARPYHLPWGAPPPVSALLGTAAPPPPPQPQLQPRYHPGQPPALLPDIVPGMVVAGPPLASPLRGDAGGRYAPRSTWPAAVPADVEAARYARLETLPGWGHGPEAVALAAYAAGHVWAPILPPAAGHAAGARPVAHVPPAAGRGAAPAGPAASVDTETGTTAAGALAAQQSMTVTEEAADDSRPSEAGTRGSSGPRVYRTAEERRARKREVNRESARRCRAEAKRAKEAKADTVAMALQVERVAAGHRAEIDGLHAAYACLREDNRYLVARMMALEADVAALRGVPPGL